MQQVVMHPITSQDISNTKSNLATVVKGNPKAPFSIATTTRCRRGGYSFPLFAPLTFDTYLIRTLCQV